MVAATKDNPAKCFIIDPLSRAVTESQYCGDYRELYAMIDCDTFTAVGVNADGDSLFLDDEGLINGKPQQFFAWLGYANPLAGKAVVLGTDGEGDSVSPTITLDEVRSNIVWLDPVEIEGHTICFVPVQA